MENISFISYTAKSPVKTGNLYGMHEMSIGGNSDVIHHLSQMADITDQLRKKLKACKIGDSVKIENLWPRGTGERYYVFLRRASEEEIAKIRRMQILKSQLRQIREDIVAALPKELLAVDSYLSAELKKLGAPPAPLKNVLEDVLP